MPIVRPAGAWKLTPSRADGALSAYRMVTFWNRMSPALGQPAGAAWPPVGSAGSAV